MLRLMGIFLILTGSMGIGWNICRKMDDRIRQLEMLQGLFRIVESEVNYHKVVLPEAFQKAGDRTNECLGELMHRIYERMKSGQGVHLETIWKEEVGKWLTETELKEKEKQILIDFSRCTGYSDGQMQLGEIQRVRAELQDAKRQAMNEKENRQRLVFSLSIAGGLLVVILLL